MAILVISDELPEALGIADRIMVVKNGKIVKEIHRGNDFNENSIIEVMI